jgi:UrcA family protein
MRSQRSLAPVAVALLALGGGLGHAAAETITANTRSTAVRYGELDLSDEAAVEALYARLAAAAQGVCGVYDLRDLRARRDWRACYEAALADAVARLPSAALAAKHRMQRGERTRSKTEVG